jgi:septal ring factor EnvC (AmiA/AmiB activator)
LEPTITRFRLIIALLPLFCAGVTQAAGETGDSARAKARLADVRTRIAALTARLGEELKVRDGQSARLREADLAVTEARRRIDALHAAEVAAARRRTELVEDESRVQRDLDAERSALAAQVRAAYLAGRQEPLRLLLSQNDPASAGRMSVYYGYFARDRADRIAEIDARAARSRDLLRDIEQSTAALKVLQQDRARELQSLEQVRAERVAALSAVSHRVDTGNHEIADLKREEQAEEALVADLSQVAQDFPQDGRQSFESLRGRLAWPVAGRVTSRFGDTVARDGSDLRANGVLIEASRGAKVRAPYFGRVIYADWLQGLGLLLIVSHAGNFMTLYGHAEVLYKAVGDAVAPGDVIAGLSDTAAAAPHLYFEIRQGRKTLDPRLWLKARP